MRNSISQVLWWANETPFFRIKNILLFAHAYHCCVISVLFITTRFSYLSLSLSLQKHFHLSVNYKRLSNVLFDKDAANEAEAERNKKEKKRKIMIYNNQRHEHTRIHLHKTVELSQHHFWQMRLTLAARHWSLVLGTAYAFPFEQILWCEFVVVVICILLEHQSLLLNVFISYRIFRLRAKDGRDDYSTQYNTEYQTWI